MKKTQLIDLMTTIRQTAVSFIAITVFLALGLAFYGGITWSVAHARQSLNQTYQDGHIRTLLVTDPLGITENQVSELTSIEGIDEAEGLNMAYRFFENQNGITQQAALVQMTENIDRLMNIEGELPASAGQTAVLRSWAEENNAAIGDTIVLQKENATDYRERTGSLEEMTLTITAIADSPVYLSTNAHAHGICYANGLYIDAVFFVTGQDMLPEEFGGYTSVLLYSNTLNQTDCFSNAYKSASGELREKVQAVFDDWDRERTGQDGIAAVTETDANNSFLTAENLIGVLGNLSAVLGPTFLVIGVLICYSVVSRLVADSAVQIGTRKALGFSGWEILCFYLSYVGAAIFLGGLLSIPIGVFGIEQAFAKVLAAQFTFSEIPLICDLTDILPVFLIICIILIAVTTAACAGETRKDAVALLQKAFRNGESGHFIMNTRVLQKFSLFSQTILINLYRDRKRVFGMITGIAGSAALLAAALTFYFNFTTAFSKQFQDYYLFDYQVCYDASSDTASSEIRQVLDHCGLDYAEIYTSCFVMHTPDGKTNAPNVVIPVDTAELAKLMVFDTENEKGTTYDSGVWMSNYYHYAFDAETGSLLNLQTLDGKEASVPVDMFYEQHLSTPVIVMDQTAYQDAFNAEVAPNAFYVVSEGFDMQQLKEELKGIDGYIYTDNFYESCLASYESEKMVVLALAVVFSLLAVLMSLMTIVNLLDIYILEKKNELIILMINGYECRFAKKYIYQDTIVLTIIGILIGLIAGSILGDQSISALEGTSIRLIHGINFMACGLAALATAGLTALVCIKAMRRIDRFRLSDIDSGR